MKKDKAIHSALRAGLLVLDVDGESEEEKNKKDRPKLCGYMRDIE